MIKLFAPPLIDVLSVIYVDPDGNAQTLNPTCTSLIQRASLHESFRRLVSLAAMPLHAERREDRFHGRLQHESEQQR